MSPVTRREVLKTAASAIFVSPVASVATGTAFGQTASPAAGRPNPYGRRGLGGATSGFSARMRANAAAAPPVDFVDYCHGLGLGGVACARRRPIRRGSRRCCPARVDDMRIMFSVRLPAAEADWPGFEATVKAASEMGATGLRGALTQRRYEQFDSFAAFKENFEGIKALVARVEPLLRRYRVPLALENHKGWRAAEQAAWLKALGSEYVGVLLDFGNNVSLCEEPMQTLDLLLPYTKACHIKDMAVQPYEDGFLLSEVPLGDGFLDLKAMVARLREQNPAMGFDLEMITRDPLRIPVFTDKYWVTFDDRYSPLPGRDLARILAHAHHDPLVRPVPRTSGLSPAERVTLEDANNARCIEWARANLDL